MKKAKTNPAFIKGMTAAAVLLALLAGCTKDTAKEPTPTSQTSAIIQDENEITEETEYMASYYTEKYRPQYHITPETNWLNDPNGLVYYEGTYHVFYQYNPDTKFPGDVKYWAHVTSTDLVHWEPQPVALEPDRYGNMWSGSAVADEHNTSGLFDDTGSGLVAFYTVTGSRQQQAMAYSKDGGITWTKYNNGKPILTVADDPMKDANFRDPKVFWHEESGRWMMIVAGGPLRFYSSENLIDWKQEGTSDIHTECPDLFRMKVEGTNTYKWVLSGAGVWYRVGDFKQVNGLWTFVPQTDSRSFNFGPDVYAGQTFYGTGDRTVMIEWMTDVGYAMELGNVTDPWSGALTIPYELTLKKSGRNYYICSTPVEELSSLRGKEISFTDLTLNEDSPNPLADLQYDKCEIEMTVNVGENAGFVLTLRAGNGQYTSFSYNPSVGLLCLDRSCSGASPTGRFLSNYTAAVEPEDGKINLHLFMDRSSVEIFAMDGKYPFTALIFPDESSVGMELSAIGGPITVEQMSIYSLNSIYDGESYQKIPSGVEAVSEKNSVFVGDTFTVWAVTDPLNTDGIDLKWSVSDGLELLSTTEKSAVVKATAEGRHSVSFTATAGDAEFKGSTVVSTVKNGFATNLENFTVFGGSWTVTEKGLYASGRGNSPILSETKAANFVYEATFHYTGSNIGCALIFRATDNLSGFYTADINLSARSARILKFTRNPSTGASSDITLGSPFTFETTADHVYKLKIVTKGDLLEFYVNDVLAVSVRDSSHSEGKFGLNVCDADGYFTDVFFYEADPQDVQDEQASSRIS